MRLVDSKRIVAEGYDEVAHRYAELERAEAQWPRMRWLADLLSHLPDGSDVLDVGCGDGVPATRAIAERHNATGIEISAVQAELARRNVPEARVLHGDVMRLDLAPASFDAIVAFYVVEHLPREEHARLFARLAGWLRPDGYLLFTIEPHDEPGVVGDWLGAPMFLSQFDAETTLGLVRDAGFEIVRQAVETQLEGSRGVAYLWVLARRSSAGAS